MTTEDIRRRAIMALHQAEQEGRWDKAMALLRELAGLK